MPETTSEFTTLPQTEKGSAATIVQLENLQVRYGDFEALRGISLSLPAGAIGLVGRNGAGKSTLMRLLLGLIAPSAGQGQVLGIDLKAAGSVLRRTVGYMPENDAFLVGMRGLEQVALAGELCGLGQRQSIRRAHEVLTYVGLSEARYRNVEQYSTGMKQRLKLAVALAHDPQLLLLDEPTVGLDPPGRQRMLDLIDGLVNRFRKSLIISTHLLDDIQQTCKYVVMIERGQVLFSGSLATLMRYEQPQYRLRWDGDGSQFLQSLRNRGARILPDPRGLSAEESPENDAEVRVAMPPEFDTREFFLIAAECSLRLRTLEPNHEDLSDLYHRLLEQGKPK
ncbi:MAG: ABC transporter ATP-binding protein [Pirellulaceae bacterium]|nr:ABC transporter ATP-binding protein [Pirellulaceae bacterium]